MIVASRLPDSWIRAPTLSIRASGSRPQDPGSQAPRFQDPSCQIPGSGLPDPRIWGSRIQASRPQDPGSQPPDPRSGFQDPGIPGPNGTHFQGQPPLQDTINSWNRGLGGFGVFGVFGWIGVPNPPPPPEDSTRPATQLYYI